MPRESTAYRETDGEQREHLKGFK
jgi:hypothetical protein